MDGANRACYLKVSNSSMGPTDVGVLEKSENAIIIFPIPTSVGPTELFSYNHYIIPTYTNIYIFRITSLQFHCILCAAINERAPLTKIKMSNTIPGVAG